MTAVPTLSVSVAQPPCVPRDVEANAGAHSAAIRAAGTRVVVFPELSLTGYELDAAALSAGDRRLDPIREACASTGSVALVGAPVLAGGAVHIGMLAIDGAGAAIVYRKMWLGDAERARFSPGERAAVLEVDGWRLGLAICKDTGVAQHAADTAALGIDAYVAGVCELAVDDPVKDERAVRIATGYGVWVAVASFAGPTGGGFDAMAGRSGIWAPGGVLVAQAGERPGELVTATMARTGTPAAETVQTPS